MTKDEAVKYFKEEVYPTLDKTDRPLVRMTWNDYVDSLCKNGNITQRQAATWDQPKFVSGK